MAGSMSIGGLISGIDTNAMLDQLREAARTPIRRLEARKETLTRQTVAWAEFESKLLSFRTLAGQLARPAAIHLYTTTMNRTDIVAASAGSGAAPGIYSFTVQSLAQTHQLASQGFADLDKTFVGNGIITIQQGEQQAIPLAVENLTLRGLQEAINQAEMGVTASIVNDGDSAAPYRLVLTSTHSGRQGELSVSLDLNGGVGLLLAELQAASDAQLTLGSGEGAITVKSGANTLTGVIEGVTISLLQAAPGETVTLTVARDSEAIKARIDNFVSAYNELVSFFSDQFSYDAASGRTGTLFGDHRLQILQQQLSRSISGSVAGLSGRFRSLSELGIRVAGDGRLTVDSMLFSRAIADHPQDVARVFAAVGETTHPNVTFLTASERTQPSGAVGWEIDIIQTATPSQLTAGAAQTTSLSADETVTINGVAIKLLAGMTQSEVLETINSQSNRTGVVAANTRADGAGEGNYLTLRRTAYGSAYRIETFSTTSNEGEGSSGIGTVPITAVNPEGESGAGTGAAGLDIAGAVGGFSTTGAGRRLTVTEGAAAGLSLLITSDYIGAHGDITFTLGAAEASLRECLKATDLVDGTIARARNSLQERAADLDAEILRIEELVASEQDRLRTTFAAMERALARFESQSAFLASYITQMQTNAPKGK